MILEFRKIAQNGGCSRIEYLAYAFLRGRKYISLEAKINEDKFPEIGRNSFLYYIAVSMAYKIYEKVSGKEEYEKRSEFIDPLNKEIRSWLFEKYNQNADEKEEVAASTINHISEDLQLLL